MRASLGCLIKQGRISTVGVLQPPPLTASVPSHSVARGPTQDSNMTKGLGGTLWTPTGFLRGTASTKSNGNACVHTCLVTVQNSHASIGRDAVNGGGCVLVWCGMGRAKG
jgi:hypothetical protein